MIDRRTFLKRFGIAGAGMGFGLRGRAAFAGPEDTPRRLIVVSHCHGWPYDSWPNTPPPPPTDTAE